MTHRSRTTLETQYHKRPTEGTMRCSLSCKYLCVKYRCSDTLALCSYSILSHSNFCSLSKTNSRPQCLVVIKGPSLLKAPLETHISAASVLLYCVSLSVLLAHTNKDVQHVFFSAASWVTIQVQLVCWWLFTPAVTFMMFFFWDIWDWGFTKTHNPKKQTILFYFQLWTLYLTSCELSFFSRPKNNWIGRLWQNLSI